MKKEKRFPTIIGLIILMMGIVAGSIFSSQSSRDFRSKASGDCTPINPQVTNITNTSLDVSFVTSADCLANLSIDNRIIEDIRFAASGKTPTSSKIHYFQVTNLSENTEYSYSFILSGDSYVRPEYKITTGKKPVTAIPLSDLAWGRVYTPDLKPAVDSIVYLNIPGGSPLSSFVTSNGHWNIPLATSFNQDKNNWFNPPLNTDEEIIVLNSNHPATQITSNTNRNNPVPDIIIGENQFSSLPVTGNLATQSLGSANSKSLEIISPKEGETIFTKRPDIFGNASSNSLVTLLIEPGSTSGNTTSVDDGTWHWYVTKELSPGDYIVTATSKNSYTGYIDTVSRKFTVSANASNLAFSASNSAQLLTITPSVSITPTISQIITSTPTSSVIATATPAVKTGATITPTKSISPTTSSKVTPTVTRTATISSSPTVRPTTTVIATRPSTSSGVPVTGIKIPTIIISTFAAIFITAALIL